MEARKNCSHSILVGCGSSAQASSLHKITKGAMGMLSVPPPFSLPSFQMNIHDRRCLLCLKNHAYETPSNQHSQYSKFESQPCMLSLSRPGVYGFSNGNTFNPWEAQKRDGHVVCLIQNRNCRCLCLFSPKRSKHSGHAVCLRHPACGCRYSQHGKLLSGLRKLKNEVVCCVLPAQKTQRLPSMSLISLTRIYLCSLKSGKELCMCSASGSQYHRTKWSSFPSLIKRHPILCFSAKDSSFALKTQPWKLYTICCFPLSNRHHHHLCFFSLGTNQVCFSVGQNRVSTGLCGLFSALSTSGQYISLRLFSSLLFKRTE